MHTKQQPTEETIIPLAENIAIMTTMAWSVAMAALWPNINCSSREKTAAKKQIRSLLLHCSDPYKAYVQFCERVLLTRKQWLYRPFPLPQLPSRWLDPGNKKGYASSGTAYVLLQETRKRVPLFRQESKALAEALLEIGEAPFKENFIYWTNWFNQRQAHEEGMLFHCSCAKALFE